MKVRAPGQRHKPPLSAGQRARRRDHEIGLEYRAGRDDKWAQRRTIEYMLQQRLHAEALYDKPDYAMAAQWLRPLAYGGSQRESWALLTLAMLYIAGAGLAQRKPRRRFKPAAAESGQAGQKQRLRRHRN